MSTSKFKVGDRVRCVDNKDYKSLTVGKIYTIVDIKFNGLIFIVDDDYELCDYMDKAFELVSEYLTPEEVFEHLRKGTKLQHLIPNHGWRDVTTPNEMYYEDICNEKFRVKPEPEIITLNGKRYQALED